MSNSFTTSFKERSSNNLSIDDNRGRRLSEMYRRLKSLQAKRFHLRNELAALEKYLGSLDSQIKSYEHYEEIGFNRYPLKES